MLFSTVTSCSWTITRWAKFIRVLAPHEHVYMAGPWLAERNVPRGTILKLDQDNIVGAGQETIHHHTDQFLIFDNAPGNPEAKPHFELLLPRPDAILKSEVVHFDSSMVVIDTPGVAAEARAASLDLRPVFKYYLPIPRSPPSPRLLDGHDELLQRQAREKNNY
jgi:hypothetical protein